MTTILVTLLRSNTMINLQSLPTRKLSLVLSAFLLAVFTVGCDSNEPDEDAGEEELITHVTLQLTSQSNSTTVEATAQFDEAGVLQQVDTLKIIVGHSYNGSIEFRDDLNGEDITEEVEEEDDFHRVFFLPLGVGASRLVVNVTDQDGNGDPLGLAYTVTDSGATEDELEIRVRLRHYEEGANLPDDKANDDGLSETPGVVENDVDVTFPVLIQF